MDLNVTEGDPLSINCTYTGAERIFWRRNGAEITPENTNFQIVLVAADTLTLSLRPSADHTVHSGAYECVAVIGSSEFSSSFDVTVQCKYVHENI